MQMSKEFLEMFANWMSDNMMSFTWIDDDIIEIQGAGRFYIWDSIEADSVFEGKDNELRLTMPILPGELVDDGITNTIVKWGNNFYFTDVNEIDLKILKYLGKCNLESDIDYVNLGVHTPFDLLNGSGMPDKWVEKAKFFGHSAIGICDKHTLGGTLILQQACQKNNMKNISGYTLEIRHPMFIGLSFDDWYDKNEGAILDELEQSGATNEMDYDAEKEFDDRYEHYCEANTENIKFEGKVYCLSNEGWRNMLRIQKAVRVDNYLDPHISLQELLIRSKGNAFVFGATSSENINQDIVSSIKAVFSQVYYQFDATEFKANRYDEVVLNKLQHYISHWIDIIPPILICDNYYLDAEYWKDKKILNKVAKGASHEQSDKQFFKHISQHIDVLKPLFTEMDISFNDFLKTITDNTYKIADACDCVIETGKLYAPQYEQTKKEYKKYKGNNRDLFLDIIEDGFVKYVPKGKEDIYRARLDHEIYVIEATNNIDYYLITRDQVFAASEMGVQTGVGRGSAGGCLISYLMDIVTIDPMTYDLIFERFLTAERCGLLPQKTTVVGDDVDIDKGDIYLHLELEDGSILNLTEDSEVMILRKDKKMEIMAKDILPDDDILFDRRDELWELNQIVELKE